VGSSCWRGWQAFDIKRLKGATYQQASIKATESIQVINMPLCAFLDRECSPACLAHTVIYTMEEPKAVCLRLLREHQNNGFTVADKATEDVAVGEPTPLPVYSPALVEMYR